MAFALRLADLLTDPNTTLAAKQFICFKLQTIGTSDQVPFLAKMLDKAATAEMARMALEQIPGKKSLAVLRGGLDKYEGKLLIGIINSLAARKDLDSVEPLSKLAGNDNKKVADAAIWALGRIGGDKATGFLANKVAQSDSPLPQNIAVAYLRCAQQLSNCGKTQAAETIYRRMCKSGCSLPSRQAGLQGLLDLAGDKKIETILAWLADADPLKRQTAADELNGTTIDTRTAETLLASLPQLPTEGKVLLLEALAAKRLAAARPAVIAAAKSDIPAMKMAGLRSIGTVGDVGSVALLIGELANESQYSEAAEKSLVALPGESVDREILAAMKGSPEAVRGQLIDILRRRKSELAVSSFLVEAANQDADVYLPAIIALRSLAGNKDLPSMLDLLIKTPRGKHRDEIEKTMFFDLQ